MANESVESLVNQVGTGETSLQSLIDERDTIQAGLNQAASGPEAHLQDITKIITLSAAIIEISSKE